MTSATRHSDKQMICAMTMVIGVTCGLLTSTLAQDSAEVHAIGLSRTIDPIVRNLSEVGARIVPSVRADGDAHILEFRIASTRNDVYVGEVCYTWRLRVGGKGQKIGKSGDDTYPNNPSDRILVRNILEMVRVFTGRQFRDFVKKLPEHFDKAIIAGIDDNSVYLYGWITEDTIYRIPRGLTTCKIAFSLQAKCGFHDVNDQPVYPDTLYQGTITGDFSLNNSNSELVIQADTK